MRLLLLLNIRTHKMIYIITTLVFILYKKKQNTNNSKYIYRQLCDNKYTSHRDSKIKLFIVSFCFISTANYKYIPNAVNPN